MPEELPGLLRGGVGWGLGLMLARRGDRMKLRGSWLFVWF